MKAKRLRPNRGVPAKAAPAAADLDRPAYDGHSVFIDRELSWLAFNRRVLEEAQGASIPLLERLRFLAIMGNNLDEFFEVRVAALLQRVESGSTTDGIARLDAREKLRLVLEASQAMVRDQYRCWDDLRDALRAEGVFVKDMADLSRKEREFVQTYFRREVVHLLTPIRVDPAHPFPGVINKALCLALLLKEPIRGRHSLGVVTIPRSLPRVVALPSPEGSSGFVFIGDIVREHVGDLFKGYPIKECGQFRVTRNSNLYIEEEEGEDESLIDTVEQEVRNRRQGDAVRLEMDQEASPRLSELLQRNFEIDSSLVFRTGRPVNLNRLTVLYDLLPQPRLKYPPYHAPVLAGFKEPEAIFETLHARDVLLHHPFESFEPVVNFIETAAKDPKVLAIKATLYRTSADSPVMYALMEAAQRGKEVVAVVELKARFDEQSNIRWARQLEQRGGTVVYGLVGLKTHCKLAMIVRKEESGFQRYAHVGTGNYNPDTARQYTDLSLLTGDPRITEGVSEVFNFITANARNPDFHGLWVSPLTFLSGVLALIRRERHHAKEGLPCGVIVKVNALMDQELIEALYAAARDGVPVRLIVRGICALRPGAPGLSENIQVKSVVGRYLEHSRVFCFRNGGDEDLYIGSGDWMTRNLRERVEVVVPIGAPELRARLLRLLAVYWHDNEDSRWMDHQGIYHRALRRSGQAALSAQDWFMAAASGDPESLPVIPPLWEDGPGRANPLPNMPMAEGSPSPKPASA